MNDGTYDSANDQSTYEAKKIYKTAVPMTTPPAP
jgi:hypothetical protein